VPPLVPMPHRHCRSAQKRILPIDQPHPPSIRMGRCPTSLRVTRARAAASAPSSWRGAKISPSRRRHTDEHSRAKWRSGFFSEPATGSSSYSLTYPAGLMTSSISSCLNCSGGDSSGMTMRERRCAKTRSSAAETMGDDGMQR
jgi:hypothetical protein